MPSPFAWFPPQVFQPRRYRPGNIGNWSGHLPFAHDLIAAVRPSCVVELGTHLGESYFGFCQAIAENQVPALAYAVDTWVGEAHAGFYDNSVYEEVLAYNQANYSNFSYLLRSLFDDALQNFADHSIDILHIDGLHTFEAVSHDFYAWLPKVRSGGIILLHDVCARHLDFGVWKLWEKLKIEGETFEFHHSWGLGIFRKPGAGAALKSELLKALFQGETALQEQVRRYYTLAANELALKHCPTAAKQKELVEDHPRLQVYSPSSGGYEEDQSQTVTVKPNQWQCVTVDILEGVAEGAIRLDPADRPMIIEVKGIVLMSTVDQTPLWSSSGSALSRLGLGGTVSALDSDDTNGFVRLFSYGNDPQLYLPSLEAGQLDQPLTVKIWLRLKPDLGALLPMIEAPRKDHDQSVDLRLRGEIYNLNQKLEQAIEELDAELNQKDTLVSELQAVKAQCEATRVDREHLIHDINRKQTKLYLLEDLRQELKQENTDLHDGFVSLEKSYLELKDTFIVLETAHSELQKAHAELQTSYSELQASHSEMQKAHSELQTAHAELQASHKHILRERQALDTTLTNVLRSRSWRLTAPLRSVTETLKSRSASGNSN
jgi:hypothetical protein